DLDLTFGEVRSVAAHVIEEQREVVHPDLFQRCNFLRERFFCRRAEVEMNFDGTESYTEANAGLAARSGQLRQALRDIRGVRLAPQPAQMRVGLGRVEVEAIAVRREERHGALALFPAP